MTDIPQELLNYSSAGIMASVLLASVLVFSQIFGFTSTNPFSNISFYLLSSSAGAILLYLYRVGTSKLRYSMMEEFMFVIAVTLLTPLTTFLMGASARALERYNR